MEEDLKVLNEKYESMKEIFENDDEAGLAWHEKKSFKDLLANLETQRNLEQHKVDLNSKKTDLQNKKAFLAENLETLNRVEQSTGVNRQEQAKEEATHLDQDLEDAKLKIQELNEQIEHKRIHSKNIKTQSLMCKQFSERLFTSLYGYNMPSEEIQHADLISEKASELMGRIKAGAEEELWQKFEAGEQGVEIDIMGPNPKDMENEYLPDLFSPGAYTFDF